MADMTTDKEKNMNIFPVLNHFINNFFYSRFVYDYFAYMDVHATYMPGVYGNDEHPCEGWVSDCGPLLVQVLFAIEPTHMH